MLLQAAWAGAHNIQVFLRICHCLSALFWATHSANCIYFPLPTGHVPWMEPQAPVHGYPCVGQGSLQDYPLCTWIHVPTRDWVFCQGLMSVTGREKRLLGGPTPKSFADCFPRDHDNCGTDKRIPQDSPELGHSQPLAEEKGRCPRVGMGMRCHPSSVGARIISSLNSLHSKLRATIHEKKAK